MGILPDKMVMFCLASVTQTVLDERKVLGLFVSASIRYGVVLFCRSLAAFLKIGWKTHNQCFDREVTVSGV